MPIEYTSCGAGRWQALASAWFSGKTARMRLQKTITLLAVGVLLASCGEPAAPAKPVHYTLSPEDNARYLADYAAKPGVFKTADGLEYRILKSGTGKTPQSGDDLVTVDYKGALIDGTVFDKSEPGQPATFPAGRLIPGWVEALSMMKEGDQWELVIPSDLGYGPDGAGDGAIPGGQTLVFQMTLLAVTPATP